MIRKEICTGIVLFFLAAGLNALDYKIAPAASWIKAFNSEELRYPDAADSSYGYTWGLMDLQFNTKKPHEYYQEIRCRVDNQEGLSNLGQFSLNYDPSYEELILHFVRIRRQGTVISEMDKIQIQVLQREASMEYLMYDGSKNLHIIVPDLRVGDILEYAYTTRGSNPILEDNFSFNAPLQYNIPLGALRLRLLGLKDQFINYQIKQGELKPRVKYSDDLSFTQNENKDFIEYEWLKKNIPAKIFEEQVPVWEDSVDLLQVSSLQNWSQVRDWAQKVFEPYSLPNKEIKDAVKEILKDLEDPIERRNELIRFVQKDVRYLGLEFGSHAYKPHKPEETLHNRFGDCKDKALLLKLMLACENIDSELVLVNSSKRRFVKEQLPAISAFDHVVLHILEPDSWVDATDSSQASFVPEDSGLAFGWGLAFGNSRDPQRTLIEIPQARYTANVVVEEFSLPKTWDGSGSLTVSSIYEGPEANNMRNQLANNSLSKMERQYKDFYSYSFPDIQVDKALDIQELETGKIVSTESYTIDKIWDVESADEEGNFSYYPMIITEYLKYAKPRDRSESFALNYPLELKETVKYSLPEYSWNIESETFSEENDFFDFSMRVLPVGKTLFTIDYSLKTKNDYVAPEQIAAYNKAVEKVYDNFQYSFYPKLADLEKYKPSLDSGRSNEAFTIIVRIGAVILVVAASRYFQRKRKEKANRDLNS